MEYNSADKFTCRKREVYLCKSDVFLATSGSRVTTGTECWGCFVESVSVGIFWFCGVSSVVYSVSKKCVQSM